MSRINFLNSPVDAFTMSQTVESIKERIQSGEFTQHVVVNVAKVVNMKNDFELSKSVTDCDIINIDGMGVVWGARMLGHEVPERVAGVDLFHQLNGMAEEEGFPVFFLGATEDVVHRTAEVMQGNHPNLNIAGYHHGYFWDNEEALVKKVKDSGAKLLFVAITSPKKENFINKWRDELGVDFVMGVGGTFDVVAGKVNRAPKWMQDNGLEWFYRIVQEPRRMWKRYAITNSKFAWLVCKAKWDQKVRRKKST